MRWRFGPTGAARSPLGVLVVFRSRASSFAWGENQLLKLRLSELLSLSPHDDPALPRRSGVDAAKEFATSGVDDPAKLQTVLLVGPAWFPT